MHKILIHTEEITANGSKLQLQIKLPETIEKVTGVFAGITRLPGVAGPADPADINAGSLWLRIPELRDVFYADRVQELNHLLPEEAIQELMGQAMQPEWWFSGTRYTFFDVTVPVEDTLIEGFYEDESSFATVHYRLNIYLNLYLK
ncbi:MAG: hypothetical protein HYZ14_15335 [Bacteroidetes bacterium]|nr:hypothetical protein [Bacteroidota bacterium]